MKVRGTAVQAVEAHERPITHNPGMEPQIQHARTADGVSIAFTQFEIVPREPEDAMRLDHARRRE